jgi:hypothetical protein
LRVEGFNFCRRLKEIFFGNAIAVYLHLKDNPPVGAMENRSIQPFSDQQVRGYCCQSGRFRFIEGGVEAGEVGRNF